MFDRWSVQPTVPASRRFTSDAGVMFSVIKPDKTADFEAVMARVKEGLGKVTGTMPAATRHAILTFQSERGLWPTGAVDASTWQALLTLEDLQAVAVDTHVSSSDVGSLMPR